MARTGRPRQFDREVAVESALKVFWEHGYDATSLARLRDAMGVSSASLYAAFGSKEGLFQEVVRAYASSFGMVTAAVADPERSPRDAIEELLRSSARMQTDRTHPLGCLVALGATVGSDESDTARTLLAEYRHATRDNVIACIRRAKARGELAASVDPETLAAVITTFLYGISVEARDGKEADVLDAAIDQLMGVWDAARMAQ